LEVVPFDAKAAQHYGRIRTELRQRGVPIGANDLRIAAHALSLGVCLVTNNVRECERIPELCVERWG
jgi:tRNA(fMet)-specific endonuclease VapC